MSSSLDGYTEVLLADGSRIRGVLPTPNELARRDLLPDTLARVAVALGDPRFLEREREEEGFRGRLIEYTLVCVASFPRERHDPDTDTWVPFTLTTEAVERIGDAVVRDQLEDLVLRARSASEVSAQSALILAVDEPEEVVPGVDGYAGFRGEPVGAPGGSDGGPVGAPPEPAARGRRPGGRVRGGRGAGDQAPTVGDGGAGSGEPEEGAR